MTYFVEKKGIALGRAIERVPLDAIEDLTRYEWPGNIRELENVIERAIILSRDGTLSLEGMLGDKPKPAPVESAQPRPSGTAHLMMSEMEREHILGVCEASRWRIKGPGSASQRLDMKPSTLYFRMRKVGISRPRSPSST